MQSKAHIHLNQLFVQVCGVWACGKLSTESIICQPPTIIHCAFPSLHVSQQGLVDLKDMGVELRTVAVDCVWERNRCGDWGQQRSQHATSSYARSGQMGHTSVMAEEVPLV